MLTVEAVFNDKETIDIFERNKHRNYEHLLEKVIKLSVNSETYSVEVVKININKNRLRANICVEWNGQNDSEQKLKGMEIYFHQKLNNATFGKDVIDFCEKDITTKLPDIRIEGKYKTMDIHTHQINEFVKKLTLETTDYKQNGMDKLKPLKSMTNEEINNIACFWMLSDQKFISFAKQIMQIIKEKNIEGILLEENKKKQLDIKTYLNEIIGEYVDLPMLKKMSEELSRKELAGLDSHQVAEFICKFPVECIADGLMDDAGNEIDGEWIINNINNNKFINNMQKRVAINQEDAKQIHILIKKCNVPSNEIIVESIINQITLNLNQSINISNLRQCITTKYAVQYDVLCIKLKNNRLIDKEAVIIADLFHHLAIDYDRYKRDKSYALNYNVISRLYEILATVIGTLCLTEWRCCDCDYMNRSCQINGKLLKPSEAMMSYCLICGIDKIKSLTNTLQNKYVQRNLYYNNYKYDEKIECIDNKDILQCKMSQQLLNFIKIYNNQNHIHPNYVDILSKLSKKEVHSIIVSEAIKNINVYHKKYNKLFAELFDNEQQLMMNGNSLCCLTEQRLISIINELNPDINISIGAIKAFYILILTECDKYVSYQQQSIYGVSYSAIVEIWQHVFETHLDYNDHSTYSPFTQNIDECIKSKCFVLTRNKRQHPLNVYSTKRSEYHDIYIDYNQHIQEQILTDNYCQSIFDSIHCNICHTKQQRKQIKVQSFDSDDFKFKEAIDTPTDTKRSIEMTEVKYNEGEDQSDELENDEDEENARYVTDIGLFGFGVDHNHKYLGPHPDNNHFKQELLNSGYIGKEKWNTYLNTAMNKFKRIVNNTTYLAKQYSSEYNICRGDKLSVHHILAILIYTSESKLCTEYRSCFRPIPDNESVESIKFRHSRFYFLSRYLYEAIEYFGLVMDQQQTVYHGLDKTFLFNHFSTHFNAPTSTSTDDNAARIFKQELGIILKLCNGNKNIQNSVVALYRSYQPRYIDVEWISPFGNESELLFYGDNVIFEIVDIEHKEIKPNTLPKLNLFQRIIKNKEINWIEEERKSAKRLQNICNLIGKTREMNIEIHRNSQCGRDGLLKLLQTNNMSDQQCTVFMEWVEREEYDTEALNDDITLDNLQFDYKNNSNVYRELNGREELMESIEKYLYFTNVEQIIYLKSILSESMNSMQFIQSLKSDIFKSKLIEDIDINQDAFKRLIEYCTQNRISGKQFVNIEIDANISYSMYQEIKKKVMEYDNNINKTIENTEKQNTQKYDVSYSRKLWHFFCISQRDYVCFRSIHKMPDILLNALLIKDTRISMTKCTDLFSNTPHIALTELSYQYLLSQLNKFCLAIIKYSQNERENKYKRLKLMTLKSVDIVHSKFSVILEQIIKRYQTITTNVKMTYLFQFDMNHVIEFRIERVKAQDIIYNDSNNNDNNIQSMVIIEEEEKSKIGYIDIDVGLNTAQKLEEKEHSIDFEAIIQEVYDDDDDDDENAYLLHKTGSRGPLSNIKKRASLTCTSIDLGEYIELANIIQDTEDEGDSEISHIE